MPINIIAGSVAPTHEQVNKILDKCEEVFRAQLDHETGKSIIHTDRPSHGKNSERFDTAWVKRRRNR
jgi:hypothetical protein